MKESIMKKILKVMFIVMLAFILVACNTEKGPLTATEEAIEYGLPEGEYIRVTYQFDEEFNNFIGSQNKIQIKHIQVFQMKNPKQSIDLKKNIEDNETHLLEKLSEKMKDTKSDERIVATSNEMKEIDGDIKLLKLDILGLRNLTIIDNADKLILKTHGISLDYKNLDVEDIETFNTLAEGHTQCTFQFESKLMQGIIKRIRRNNHTTSM